MKIAYLLPLSLALTSTAYGQEEQLSAQYINAVNKDLAEFNRSKIAKSMDFSTLKQVALKEIDSTAFPVISGFFSARDGRGNHISGLNERDVKLSINHPSLSNTLDPVDLLINEIGTTSSKADIAFVIDSTGSMSGEISTVINNVMTFVDALKAADIDYRLAGFSFGDEVPYRDKINFTDDANSFKNWVSSLSADGGRDKPENPLDSLISAGTELSWRADSQQIIMLITDAPAHVANDGGNSDTTATFSLAALSTQDQTVFYSSPETQYAALGDSLSWPFDQDVLLSQLSEEVSDNYQFSYTDPVGLSDGLTRQLTIQSASDITVRDQAPYTPDLSTAQFTLTVKNNDPEPRSIAGAQITTTDGEGITKTYITDTNGHAELELGANKSYSIQAVLTGFYAPQYINVTTLQDESGEISLSGDPLTFNLSLITVSALKASVQKKLKQIKIFDPASISDAAFADEVTLAQNWIVEIPDEAAEDGSGPSDAQQEGLKRMDIATEALHKTNQYIENDIKTVGSSISKIVVTFLDLNGTFSKLQEQLRTIAARLDPDAPDWAVVRWTYKQTKALLESTATGLGELTTNLSNLLLDVIKMNLEEQHHGLLVPLKNLLAVASANPNLPLIENMAQKMALEVLLPIYTADVDTTFGKSVAVHSAITTSQTAAVLATQLNVANSTMNTMLQQAEVVKSSLANNSKIGDIIGAIGGVVGSIDSTLDVLPSSINNTIPALAAVKRTLDALDKGLKVGDIGISVANSAIASSHFLVLDSQVVNVIQTTSGGATSPVSPFSLSRSTLDQAQYHINRLNSASRQSSNDLSIVFNSANGLLKEGKVSEFFDYYLATLLPTMESYTHGLERQVAMITAADQERTYKPVNWDALRTNALTSAIEFKLLSASTQIGISSALLELSVASPAQETKISGKITQLLAKWENQNILLSANIAQATRSANSFVYYTALAGIRNIVVQPIDDARDTYSVQVTIQNIGEAPIDYLTPEINVETLTVIDEIPDSSGGDYAPGEQYTHTFIVESTTGHNDDKHTIEVTLNQDANGDTITDSNIAFAYINDKDSDSDGIPDAVEISLNLDPNDASDGYIDSDNDGITNATEYKLGLDPLNAASTESGKTDFEIYQNLLIPGSGLPGDVNQDGIVNNQDYDLLITHYGIEIQQQPQLSYGDFNRNNKIDLFDINILKKSL
ncbi:VWA domain-containing protein [Photobacterium nomapromontoriensis]|uniref:VWA domain-containing protein n=1 Tax=Photobacterium nomapromontoriensis TaxID=2910237 RepID=UPI003D0963D5